MNFELNKVEKNNYLILFCFLVTLDVMFKWPSIYEVPNPMHNGTLQSFVWSSMN